MYNFVNALKIYVYFIILWYVNYISVKLLFFKRTIDWVGVFSRIISPAPKTVPAIIRNSINLD